jgi:hypothetical protein
MEKNLKQLCKENFLAIEKKYIETKKIANMSSNDPNFNLDNTRTAQMYRDSYLYPNTSSKLGIVYPPYFMWLLNIAWYIIKHNLDDPKNKQKLIDFINISYRNCDRWIGNPEFTIDEDSIDSISVFEVIEKYLKVENNGSK